MPSPVPGLFLSLPPERIRAVKAEVAGLAAGLGIVEAETETGPHVCIINHDVSALTHLADRRQRQRLQQKQRQADCNEHVL